jgi:hypothetical protein
MSKTTGSISLAARHLAGAVVFTLLGGCAGDGLLLPSDGAPAELRMVSGNQQSAPAGDPVPHPLIVEALDVTGRPVRGAAIVFELVDPRSGAHLAPANAETDSDGRAWAEVTLGTSAGDQKVEARLDGSAGDLKVQFRLTALQRKGDGVGGGDGDGGNDRGGDDDGNGGRGGGSAGGGGNGGGGGADGGGGSAGGDRGDRGKGKAKNDGKGKDNGKGDRKGKGKSGE